MKKFMFLGCGVFLSEISAMDLDRTIEVLGRAASIDRMINCKLSSRDLGSETTLNGDVSISNSGIALHCEFDKGRRRSRSEEDVLSPNPGCDGSWFPGVNEGRIRSRSETTDYKGMEMSVSDMLESKKQREERSRVIESEHVDSMLRRYARRVSRVLEEDFFQKFTNSLTREDKINIFFQGVDDCINIRAKQKREATEENEVLTLQNKSWISKTGGQEERIEELESKLFIKESQAKVVSPVVSVERESAASVETKKSDVCNQQVNLSVPSMHIRKFEYIGDMAENMAHGKGMVSHMCGIVSIAGTFYYNRLDLSKQVEIKGPCMEEYRFEGSGTLDTQAMISMDDISKIDETYRYGLSTIFLGFSNDDGRRRWIVFNPNFVYQGEVNGRAISGEGTMVKSSGEILKGKFKDSQYWGDLL